MTRRITRAKVHLELSWARSRTPGGRAGRTASPFLTEVVATPSPAPAPIRRRSVARCRNCGKSLVTAQEVGLRRCQDCPSDLDEDLFERLRQWRAEQARERNVPAYVVFTDRTLQAMAELKPADSAALSEIAGVGPAKLTLYGDSLLRLVGGLEPE